jgi:hypothetical protein
MPADIFQRDDLPFPGSLPEFQRLFPHDAACAAYLEAIRWQHGFVCMWCGERGEPFRFANRPHVLRCRKCRKDNALTVGTVMAGTHTPLSVWFWGAYLASSLTPGLSAVQFQRQLGISRYETAFQILHKLRAGMVRPDRDQIGGTLGEHVEVDETWIGGQTRGKGKGVHDQSLVIGAVEVRERKPKKGAKPRRGGRYAGRIRLEYVPDRTALSLTSFVQSAVMPGTMIITDAAPSYATLGKLGYEHLPVVEAGNTEVAEEFLPIVHLIFSNLKKLAARLSPRRQPEASASLPQRVHLPVQPPLLPVQRLPLVARDQRARRRPNLRRALFGQLAAR